MAKKNLTDRTLQALAPAEPGKRRDDMDTRTPGFGVRVTDKANRKGKAAQRTFILVARYPGSANPTRRALGEYPKLTLEAARKKAELWHELLDRGIDPKDHEAEQRRQEARRKATTFASVAEDFIAHIERQKERKAAVVARELRQEFVDSFGDRPITDIQPSDIKAVIRKAVDRGATYQAHNLLGHARRLFNWAIAQDDYGLDRSPCDRMKPKAIIGKKLPRKRVLDDDELFAFWRASGRLGYPFGPLFRLLALTGQRKSEVAEAVWSEFDLTEKLWTIPPERMKADAAHVVPLCDDAIALLESLPRFNRGGHLFSTTSGAKPVSGFSKAKRRLDRRMLLTLRAMARKRSDARKVELRPFVIHDVRRTMRTGLSALPVADLVRELVIGHARPGLHKVYDQFAYLVEKRQALDLWAGRLRDIVTPAPENVVQLHERA